MSELMLPVNGISARLHHRALRNLVDRYESDGEPVHYERAAIDVNAPDCSSALKFFGEIELLNIEKQGVYIPPTYLINYFNKVGATKKEARKELTQQLNDYEVYSEIVFQAKRDEHTIEELAKSVAGQVGADQDEVDQIENLVEILDHLDLVEIDDETEAVSVLVDDESEAEEESEQESEEGVNKKSSGFEEEGLSDNSEVESGSLTDARMVKNAGSVTIQLEMAMDLTEMDTNAIEDKLETINEFIDNAE